jgi:hypothetical protein
MTEHLDLDALADVLAGAKDDAHLGDCAACTARLRDLEHALPGVAASLAALPVPEEPADLGERLERVLAAERAPGGATVVPLAARRRTRWMPVLGAVAAVALAAGGTAVVLAQDGDDAGDNGGTYALSSTGTDYAGDAKALREALPALLDGGAPAAEREAAVLSAPGAASPAPSGSPAKRTSSDQLATGADALATLRTDAGLASCLVALTDPADPDAGLPLALDYASYEGEPALVVVLPTTKPDKVDVFVVGAGCNQADAKLLFFTRLTRP